MYESTIRKFFPKLPRNRRTDSDQIGPTLETFSIKRKGTAKSLRRKRGLSEPQLISSFGGRLNRLLMSLPPDDLYSEKALAPLRSVVENLPQEMQLIIVFNDGYEEAVKDFLLSAKKNLKNSLLIPVPEYLDISVWAEDAYLAAIDSSSKNTFLIEPWSFRRGGDALIADAVENNTDIGAVQTPLVFQGGNCLIGDNFWLIGRDYIEESIELIDERQGPISSAGTQSTHEFVERLFKEYVESKRQMIIIGPEKAIPLGPFYASYEEGTAFLDFPTDGVGPFQPIFHIDMFISLIGRKDDGRFGVMVADPSLTGNLGGGKQAFALAQVYSDIAKDLEQRGFHVVRNPMIYRADLGELQYSINSLKDYRDSLANEHEKAWYNKTILDFESFNISDEEIIFARRYTHITWNNCIISKNTSGEKSVILPTYADSFEEYREFDEINKQLWLDEGYKVIQANDCWALAKRQGVLHCTSKYLGRDETNDFSV